jgi:VWFA-related protein
MKNLARWLFQFFHGRQLGSCAFLLLVLSSTLLSPENLKSQAAARPPGQSTTPSSPQESSGEMAVKDEANSAKVDEAATFRVNVKLVLARVVVRDSKGNALGNLHKEDFDLFDNGKPQVISHFDAEHSTPGTPPPAESADRTAATKPAEQPVVPVRYVAYLFDDLHLTFENINQVREAAERRVNVLAPTERVAIFSTSGQNQLDFTDDRAKLRQALQNLRPHPTLGGEITTCPDISLYMADLIVNKNDPEALQLAVNDYMHCTPGLNTSLPQNLSANAGSFVKGLAMQTLQIGEQDSRLAIGSLRDVVRRILLMPGQRHLVLVSPGFLTPELEYDYNDVIDRALRGQVVIGALDARGLYTVIPFGDASQPGRAETDIPGQPFTPISRAQFDLQGASLQSDILATLAYSTGGSFFHNNNDMDEGFRRVADVPDSWYVLGFTPQNLKMDGRFHTLKVKLKLKEKLDLQARRGYYAPKHAPDAAEEAKREIDDEVLSVEELHDLPVALHTQFFKATDDTARLTVLARVDVKHLHYKQAEGRNQNDLTVVTAVFDRNGNFLQSNQKVVQMRWKSETLQSKLASGITLRTSFDVKPGRYMVRVVARDTEQQLMSAENGAVEIP